MRVTLAEHRADARPLAAQANLHAERVAEAARGGARLVVFPELSLGGYRPSEAAALAVEPEDRLFDVIERAARADGATALVGAPIRRRHGVEIGLVALGDGPRAVYAKRHLHADEVPFFVPGTASPVLEIDGRRVGLAICYELFVEAHRAALADLGAELWVASVAKHARGMARATALLSAEAEARGVPVGLVNQVGPCEDFEACGGSRWLGPPDGARLVLSDA